MSGPARRLKLCVSAHRMFFFSRKRRNFACATDKILEAISPMSEKIKKKFLCLVLRAGGQSAEGSTREREKRDENLHNKTLVSANNGEENEESRYVN